MEGLGQTWLRFDCWTLTPGDHLLYWRGGNELRGEMVWDGMKVKALWLHSENHELLMRMDVSRLSVCLSVRLRLNELHHGLQDSTLTLPSVRERKAIWPPDSPLANQGWTEGRRRNAMPNGNNSKCKDGFSSVPSSFYSSDNNKKKSQPANKWGRLSSLGDAEAVIQTFISPDVCSLSPSSSRLPLVGSALELRRWDSVRSSTD